MKHLCRASIITVAALALAACAQDMNDYWASAAGMDAGLDADVDTDSDTDSDSDSDSDTDTGSDTEECTEEDGSIECGDGGDTDTYEWDGSVDAGDGGFCGDPDFEIFLSDIGYVFDNAEAPYRGTATEAEVEITGFSYFLCTHCANAAEYLEELFADAAYSDRSVYYFRNYTFSTDASSIACKNHLAVRAAQLQGKFWEVHDALYDEFPVTDEDVLLDLVEDAGCDMEQFAEDFDAGSTYDFIIDEKAEGQDAGITGTPSIFVNGIKVPYWPALQDVLDCLLGYSVYVPPDAGADGG
ncbi:MAG: DsbA family protein [Deltaproteobacteria bacterium]|nr:DsbA family protein [Deltaproteobacteria bacterium]